MQNIGSEIGRLTQELKEYKSLYVRACFQIDSLAAKLSIEETINEQYSAIFTKNPEYCNWMRDHNAQFEAFKDSPYYIKSFPQVVKNIERE
jgi:hypothetical protein